MYGFVAAQALPSRSTRIPNQSSTCPPRPRYVMQTEAAKKKKVAPLVFSKDMKGNSVWNLRSASSADTKEVLALNGRAIHYTEELLASILGGNERCSVVCEASVKGSKEGEGFKGVVLGTAVANINTFVGDTSLPIEEMAKSLVKRAEILAVDVSNQLLDPEDTKRKLVLGCLKKLKSAGVLSASYTVEERTEDVEFYTDLGFKRADLGSGGKSTASLVVADLTALNPDPKKKMA